MSAGKKITENVNRFWDKVEKRGPNDCWLYTGAINDAGVGIFLYLFEDGHTQKVGAHRVAWWLEYGVCSDYVLHSCINDHCVNIKHLRKTINTKVAKQDQTKQEKQEYPPPASAKCRHEWKRVPDKSSENMDFYDCTKCHVSGYRRKMPHLSLYGRRPIQLFKRAPSAIAK